jgi:hypothetical protein
MKKSFVLMLIAVSFCGTNFTLADCGKYGIIKRPPAQPLVPPDNSLPDVSNPPIFPPSDDLDDPAVPIPENGDDTLDGSLSLFKEPNQTALVAWNGKEQMLFLTTNEQSLAGTRPMISIMPLAGAPIDIKESDRKIITGARKLVQKKIIEKGGVIDKEMGLVFKTEIGVHKIFVWKIDDIDTLLNDLNQFIAKTYGKDYSVLISKDGFNVIKDYHDRGFKYFAFDLIQVNKAEKTKVTIMYHYKSNFAFYPVAISQVGGSGVSKIELVVLSPSGFNKVGKSIGGMDENTLRDVREGGIEVDLSVAELRSISPKLAEFFRTTGKAKARIFQFSGNLDGSTKNNLPGLNKDLILWSE